jgi:hypothetical protein
MIAYKRGLGYGHFAAYGRRNATVAGRLGWAWSGGKPGKYKK